MALDPDIEARYTQNRKVMVGSAILLLILIVVIIFFHIYVRICRRRRLRRLLSHPLPTTVDSSSTAEACLDPSVLKSLPTFTFSPAATNPPLNDCAVCLTEFADGDEGRLLPNCNHAFHAQCIDTWFGSHSTCPLCRDPVQPATGSFETQPVSSGSGSEAGEGCSSLPEPVWCPRKPLGIIVEVPREDTGSDLVSGDQGLRWSLKRFCSV